MKKNLLYFLFLILSYPLLAQNLSYTIFLKNNTQIPTVSTKQNLSNKIDFSTFNGYKYLFVQFYDIPSEKTKQSLKNQEIKLLNYIPNYTYITAVPKDYNLSKLLQYNVRSILPIKTKDKLSKRLFDNDLPAWAVVDNRFVKINLIYFKNLTSNEIVNILKSKGYKILSQQNHIHLIRLKIPIGDIAKVAELPFVLYMELAGKPAKPEGLLSKTLVHSDYISSHPNFGFSYNGAGVNIALQDNGHIGPHIDYQGRLIKDYCPAGFNDGNHGDHVAGILFGAGNIDPFAIGMAFGAHLYLYAAYPNYQAFDSIYTHYYSDSIRVISTSYGDGCNSGYTALASQLDNSIRLMPKLMDVFSAGNSGTSDCSYGAGAGWGNITGGDKSAKNVLAVAALNYKSDLASFSSHGPASDGRIKPDVCAMGEMVYSTLPGNTYGYESGTSMACPAVVGTYTQLFQAYKTLHGDTEPTSDIIKACILNTADDLGNPGPDFKYGWGRVNARKALKSIQNNEIIIDSVNNGGNQNFTINVPANVTQLRVMLYWNDYEAVPNTSKALVNDLNLSLTDPASNNWLPWVLDPTPNAVNLNTDAVRAVDTLNNVNQVTIDSPATGNYTININGTVVPQSPQKYVVVYEFVKNNITVTYPNGLEGFNPGSTEDIRWDAFDTTQNFTLQYSLDSGITWNTIANNIAGNKRIYQWTVPNVLSGQALIKISNGTTNDMSDTNFSIISTPQNLKIDWVCPDSLQFSWNSISGATNYEIFMLGNTYMDSLATTADTSIVIQSLNPYIQKWLSVKAIGGNNAKSNRAVAIGTPQQIFNCNVPHDLHITALAQPQNYILTNCFDLSNQNIAVWVKNNGTQPVSSYVLFYQINGGSITNDTINSILNSGDSALHIFSQTANLQTAGNYEIKTWLQLFTTNNNPYDDTTISNLTVKNSITITPPYTANFDTCTNCPTLSDCGATNCILNNYWINEENGKSDTADWRVNNGTTPSFGTGPENDYNIGNSSGKYLYIEASTCNFQTADLNSPCIDLTSALNPYLAFAYNMYDSLGGAMGSLHIDAFVNGVWQNDIIAPFLGNQGKNWKTDTVSLSAFKGKIIQLRFRGITGSSYTSDIAIDDISILEIPLGIKNYDKNKITISPNPANHKVNIYLSGKNNKKSSYTITEANGKIVSKNTFLGNQIAIDVSKFSAGIYILKLNINGQPHYRKLIIQH